jgi:DNA helicase II / ATP-dependent DNA helicase PcrA
LYKLEQNYRSTQTIVDAANSVIANNKEQIRKNVWTSNQKGNPIRVLRTLTDNEEGRVIAQSIHEIKTGQGREYLDFAILYRTNAQSRSFEEALRKLNIPYKIYGGLSFYQRKEIKDLLAYFRLSANPKDEEALETYHQLSETWNWQYNASRSLTIAANHYGVSMWEVITEPQSYPVSLNAAAKTKVQSFATMIKSFSVRMETSSGIRFGPRNCPIIRNIARTPRRQVTQKAWDAMKIFRNYLRV